ncbi:hypothetical protein D3C86_2169760 [compost metagenome]
MPVATADTPSAASGTPRWFTLSSERGALPCLARPNSMRLLQYTQLLYTDSAAVNTTILSTLATTLLFSA